MVIFVYPKSYLKINKVEEFYISEYNEIIAQGYKTIVFDVDDLNNNDYSVFKDNLVIYRGWMLTISDYELFNSLVEKHGGHLLTNSKNYELTHYIPNWYPLLKEFTPETHCFRNVSAARSYIQNNKNNYFIKDFVKSLRTGIGSFIDNPEDFDTWVEESEFYKGFIEGGICLREVENFKTTTENRFFVLNKKVFSNGIEIPNIVYDIVKKIDAPFYSVDIIQNYKNQYRLVEIGDGQVSSSETWSMINFVNIFKEYK